MLRISPDALPLLLAELSAAERDPLGTSIGARATARTTRSDDAAREAAIRASFADQFGALAEDEAAFHDLMKEVYGPGYDRAAAEDMRNQARAGDFSWLPEIEFVDASTLGGANGAYDKEAGKVYLNRSLDDATLAQTFVEEAGHHIDTKLNATDTAGDEGEMLRRLLGGEKLTAAQKAEIRAEDDKGTITVNGRTIEVEFWNPFKAIKKAVKKAVKAVGSAIKGAVKGIGAALEGIGKGVGTFFRGIGEGLGGFFSNVAKGRFGEAFSALGKGLDQAFIRSISQMTNGFLTALEETVLGAANLIPFVGKPVKELLARGLDATRSLVTGVLDAASSIVRNSFESGKQILQGFGKILKGDFKEGFKDIGVGLLKGAIQTPVDAILLVAGRAISAIQTLVGLEPVGRKLTEDEITQLRAIYGDSIDYDQVRIKEGFSGLFSTNDRPFTHGNTIYMKDREIDFELLAHEMAHVWQHQNGGSDYMSEALISQWWGHGYDWEASVPGTPWSELEPEQQAEFIEMAVQSGYFDDPSAGFVFGGVDYTDYLEDALEELRAGRGAP